MSNSRYDISVIIPAKNAQTFLGETLDALLNQSAFKNSISGQICLADDGSEDDTVLIMEEYSIRFAEIGIDVVISQVPQPGGVGAAKACAVESSNGRFLCFNDADDVSSPDRILKQFNMAKSLMTDDDDFIFLGGNFHRMPENSTVRYTKWANSITNELIKTQVYTSHGPTIIAPTWFVSRTLYDKVGGFRKDIPVAFPEDLDFFYKCLDVENCIFDKVSDDIVMYRYHPGCASFGVKEDTIWDMRLERLRNTCLKKWDKFTIWSAGKQGKRFFKCLNDDEKSKVTMFCDIDASKIKRGIHEEFDEKTRKVTHKIPIVHISDAKPPLVVCVKLDLTNGDLERIIEKHGWREQTDLVYFG